MARAEKRGLIGKLYHDVFPQNTFIKLNNMSDRRCSSSQNYFLKNWLGIESPIDEYWSSLVKYDVFESYYSENAIAWTNNDKFEETILSDLDNLNVDQNDVLSNLIDSLRKTTTYCTNRSGTKIFNYNEPAKERLIKYISKAQEQTDKDKIELEHYITLYIFFAVNHTVPKNLSENTRTKKDLDEFTKCVIEQYGSTSKHGIREIVRLATRDPETDPNKKGPNIIALYEYAELLFFGNAEGIKQDINAAFLMYKKAAGIDSANEQIKKMSAANPLALWSLSYIYYNYKNPLLNESLSDKCTIKEIEALDNFRDRIWRSIKRATDAYSIADLPCIANTLGLLARLIDEDVDSPKLCDSKSEIRDLRNEFNLRTCTEYFKEAADGGFVYAYNNLAEEERRKLIQNLNDHEMLSIHLEEYLKYLKKSADDNEPWAANKLGRIYLNGFKEIDDDIDESQIRICITDKNQAFEHFMRAYKIYHVFYDINCAWACSYLFKHFYNKLEDDQIVDMYDILKNYRHKTDIIENAFDQEELPPLEQVRGIRRKSL